MKRTFCDICDTQLKDDYPDVRTVELTAAAPNIKLGSPDGRRVNISITTTIYGKDTSGREVPVTPNICWTCLMKLIRQIGDRNYNLGSEPDVQKTKDFVGELNEA